MSRGECFPSRRHSPSSTHFAIRALKIFLPLLCAVLCWSALRLVQYDYDTQPLWGADLLRCVFLTISCQINWGAALHDKMFGKWEKMFNIFINSILYHFCAFLAAVKGRDLSHRSILRSNSNKNFPQLWKIDLISSDQEANNNLISTQIFFASVKRKNSNFVPVFFSIYVYIERSNMRVGGELCISLCIS